MGRKGRQRSRSSNAVARDKFPLGHLAQRRKELREEFITKNKVYKDQQKKLKKLKRKVKKAFCEIENLQSTNELKKACKCNQNRKLLKRRRHPTSTKDSDSEQYLSPSAPRSSQRRRRETVDNCQVIHGGSADDGSPTMDGLWLTLISMATPARLANYFAKSKKTMKKTLPKVVKESVKSFNNSLENKIRSLEVLYCKGMLSKEQYKGIRFSLGMKSLNNISKKTTSVKFMPNMPLPKLVPYDKLVAYVKSIDIGNLRDITNDFCQDLSDDDKVVGSYRDLEGFLIEVAAMYISIDKLLGNKSFLIHFSEDLYHFRVAIGADGAPFGKDDEATSWLISFLNVGERIASANECFLIAGANCSESHDAMKRYAELLVSQIAHIETNTFHFEEFDCDVKFSFDLVPCDMKWAALFSGELPNSAFYFSTFGNANGDNKIIVNGSLGTAETCTWKPWVYQDRLDMACKVASKKEELDNSSYAESTKRNKVLNFIREKNSRQEFKPLLGKLVDNMYAEPLHNANNAWQQLHVLMLDHALSKSHIPKSCNSLADLKECPFQSHLNTLKEIGASRLYKKVKRWFCQGRNGSLNYRFTGKETKKMCHHFMSLVAAISSENDTPQDELQICTFAFVGLHLRNAISRFSRATIDLNVLEELQQSCQQYFNACSMLLATITPTVWTIGYAIPYHASVLFRKFGVGLGINSMQGREAKHVRIAQYAKHATLTTRWSHVMRHDYITTVWMRKNAPFKSTYKKCKDVYIPCKIEKPEYCCCGLEKPIDEEKCKICSSLVYQNIGVSANNGELSPFICNLLSVLS